MQKNNLIVKTILETCFEFDILFIQEPSWSTIHSIPSSQDYNVDFEILEEISDKALEKWPPFSKKEFLKAIAKCNNLSAPKPDKLL